MARFHVNPKSGNPGRCSAQEGNCPYGSDAPHFASAEDARAYFEESMGDSKLPKMYSQRDLAGFARESAEPELLNRVLQEGSDTSLRALAKNRYVAPELLALAANSEKASEKTRLALAAHPKFPAGQLDPTMFAVAVEASNMAERTRELWSSDHLTGAHVRAVSTTERHKVRVELALKNSYNHLTTEEIIEFAEQSWANMGPATESGRYPAERISTLPKKLVYWGNIDASTRPEVLREYAQWAIGQKGVDEHNATYYSQRVAMNPETPTEALQELAVAGLALVEVYKHPRANEELRALVEFQSDEVARVAKLDRLQDQFNGRLKEEITYMERTTQPHPNRGLYDTKVRFNVERMEELGLSGKDILVLMGRDKFNGGARFDPDTGMFTGTVDSTD